MVLVRAVFQFWIASGFAYETGLNYRSLSQERSFHGNALLLLSETIGGCQKTIPLRSCNVTNGDKTITPKSVRVQNLGKQWGAAKLEVNTAQTSNFDHNSYESIL